MFKLPSVRGFPAQSNTAAVCERVEDSRKGKHAPARDVDLAKLFAAPPPIRQSAIRNPQSTIPHCSVSLGIAERKLFISTGKRRIRKRDGKAGSEEKIPVILVTVTATVTDGKREFTFSATNRSTKVLDSRDGKRKPLADVRSELLRLCANPITANSAADLLGEYLIEPRDRKPRLPAVALAEADAPPTLRVKRVPFSARKWLLSDPILKYLTRPLTPSPL